MVELHCVPPVANFHHELLAGTLKQRWLAFYGSILHMVTASCNNVWDNCTMLAMPGQFCHTICTIPSMHNAVLNSIMAEYSNNSWLGNIAFFFTQLTIECQLLRCPYLHSNHSNITCRTMVNGPSISDVLMVHFCSACNATAMNTSICGTTLSGNLRASCQINSVVSFN